MYGYIDAAAACCLILCIAVLHLGVPMGYSVHGCTTSWGTNGVFCAWLYHTSWGISLSQNICNSGMHTILCVAQEVLTFLAFIYLKSCIGGYLGISTI